MKQAAGHDEQWWNQAVTGGIIRGVARPGVCEAGTKPHKNYLWHIKGQEIIQ